MAESTIPARMATGAVTAVLVLVIWVIMRRGQVQLASVLLSALLLVNTTIALYFIGTIRAPLASNYVACIAIAGLLVGNRAALVFLLLSLLALLGLLQAEIAGLLPAPQDSTGINNWFAHAAVFTMITVLLGLTIRSINEALESARRKEQDLAEANRELQREIAERERAEEGVRESEGRYRLLADNLTDIIWTADMEVRFTYFSPSVEQAGYTVDEAMATPVAELLLPSSLELARRTLEEELEGEALGPPAPFEALNLELGVRCKDGSTMWTESRMRFLRDEKMRPVGILGVSRDITERKRLEEQLRRAQEMEAIGRLSGGVAHDFNNMLTAITGCSEFLLAELDPRDPLRGDAEEIKQAADRAAALTQQLLAFSRKQLLQLQVLDLNSVVSDTEKMLQRLVGEDVELAAILAPDIGRVKADRRRMQQVIMNLAVNARDAMPEGGRLTIETQDVVLDDHYARDRVDVEPGRYVMLTVRDTGVGMDEETRSRIFEPFFTTKEDGKGTGLGLATVYGIVKQIEGHVTVQSEPGSGTEFKIYLPRTDEAAEPALPPPAPDGLARGSETILLVEDEDLVRSMVRRALDRSDYTVLEARDGEEAALVCQRHEGSLHLLLTDVVLPGGMSGPDIAAQLVALYPELKVLYMSGYTDDAVVRHGVLEPGIAFLAKPFTPATLAHRVRQVLDER
jgi:PAS domain S-box-containing protein